MERLRRSAAQCHQFRLDRYPTRHFYADHGLEGFQLARLRDGQAQQEFLNRTLPANEFDCRLRAYRCRARQDQHGLAGVESFNQSDHSIAFRYRPFPSTGEVVRALSRLRMAIANAPSTVP